MAICSAVTSKVRLFQAYRTASSASAAVHTPKKKRSGIYLLLFLLSVGFYLWQNGNVDFSHTTYDHATQASDVIRQALLNHEEKVSFRYRTDRYDKSLLSTALSPTSQEIRAAYYAAVEHTGRPNEGDQLSRWTYLSEIMTTAYPQLNGTYIIQADCKIGYYVTKEQEAWLRTRIPAILSSLNLTGKSDYEKVRAIYNWICSHVTYDEAHLNDDSYWMKYTAYNAVRLGTAVCDGYAQLFYRLALTAGLECRIKINSNHAWNLVKLGNQYYYCDATWDSGLPESQYRYFLKGSMDFDFHTNALKMIGVADSPLLDVDRSLPVAMYGYGR